MQDKIEFLQSKIEEVSNATGKFSTLTMGVMEGGKSIVGYYYWAYDLIIVDSALECTNESLELALSDLVEATKKFLENHNGDTK